VTANFDHFVFNCNINFYGLSSCANIRVQISVEFVAHKILTVIEILFSFHFFLSYNKKLQVDVFIEQVCQKYLLSQSYMTDSM